RRKACNLDLDDFHRVMRAIGFVSFKSGKVEVSRDEFASLLERAREFVKDLKFQIADLTRDLLLAVPLFAKDGNYIRWSHKSIQDYFCSQFINKDVTDKGPLFAKLISRENINRCENILLLLAESNPRAFKVHVAKDFYRHLVAIGRENPSDRQLRLKLVETL